MKISLNKSLINFSKNPNIRKGDDIQRHARNCFPAFSPSYADIFYHDEQRHSKILDKQISEVNARRKQLHLAEKYGLTQTELGTNCWHTMSINNLDETKKGNCEEFSNATLATLLANGYKNSERKYLILKTEFINKETGKKEYEAIDSLDHAFVVSTLEKEDTENKEMYVIDSWLGFADTIEGAKSRYKELSEIRHILSAKQANRRSKFRQEKLINEDKLINTDDYEQKSTLIFIDADEEKKKINEELTKYVQVMYPKLKMKNQ